MVGGDKPSVMFYRATIHLTGNLLRSDAAKSGISVRSARRIERYELQLKANDPL